MISIELWSMNQNEIVRDIENNEKTTKEIDSNNENNANNNNITGSSEHIKKSIDLNTHSIQITNDDPDCPLFLINNVPNNITVKELRKLIIKSSEFSLESDFFLFTEDDMLLFDDDFIRGNDIKIIYYDDNDDDYYFTIFLCLHVLPLFFYFTNQYPVELSVLLYLILILLFGFYLRIKKKQIIKHARSILKKIIICGKLLFLFFYSMLPFFNADNYD